MELPPSRISRGSINFSCAVTCEQTLIRKWKSVWLSSRREEFWSRKNVACLSKVRVPTFIVDWKMEKRRRLEADRLETYRLAVCFPKEIFIQTWSWSVQAIHLTYLRSSASRTCYKRISSRVHWSFLRQHKHQEMAKEIFSVPTNKSFSLTFAQQLKDSFFRSRLSPLPVQRWLIGYNEKGVHPFLRKLCEGKFVYVRLKNSQQLEQLRFT